MSLTRKIKNVTGRDVAVQEYEEIKESDRINSAGRACYVVRNQVMIDDSDFAIFYLNENSQLKNKESGTIIVYQYANTKKSY